MTVTELPLISVGIPVFNGENYIKECVRSVLRQTDGNFELIISDNCSTDRTIEIANSFEDPRIKVFKNASNIGSIRNFNKCIELSSGDYFVLLPHDDVLMPEMLLTFGRALAADPGIGMVYSSYYIIDENGKRIGLRKLASEDKIMSSEEGVREFIAHGSPAQCAMTRKKTLSSLGGFDEEMSIWCDADLWCRILISGNKAAYFKTPQNCVRVHSGQGQRAFLGRDNNSEKTLSEHLGFTPTRAFIKDNNYNLLTFKHVQRIFSRIPSRSGLHKLRPLSAKWMLGPQIESFASSLVRCKPAEAGDNLSLIIKTVRWAGFFRTILVLYGIALKLAKQLGKRLWR